MKCNNCNSEKINYLHESEDYYTLDKFEVYFCDSCKLIFSLPNIINLDSYYPKTYRKYVGIVNYIVTLKSKYYVKKISNLFDLSKQKLSVLEIGCGDGTMLKEFKKLGWSTQGNERSVTIDKENLLNISDKPLQSFEDNYFDLVLMYNSLEHIDNPNTIINHSIKKLKKNGLFICTVPNYLSWQYKFGKNNWFHLDIPRHRNIFSIDSFKVLSNQNFYQLNFKSSTISLDLEFYGWFQTIVNKFTKTNNSFFKYLMKLDNSFTNFIIGSLLFGIFFIPSLILSIVTLTLKKGSILEIIIKKN